VGALKFIIMLTYNLKVLKEMFSKKKLLWTTLLKQLMMKVKLAVVEQQILVFKYKY